MQPYYNFTTFHFAYYNFQIIPPKWTGSQSLAPWNETHYDPARARRRCGMSFVYTEAYEVLVLIAR